MTFDCPSFCSENYFFVALSKFNLMKGPHSTSENPMESLIDCLSDFKPREDIVRSINQLRQRDPSIPFSASSIYESGLELKYGVHSALLEDLSTPNVAILSALSHLFELEIFVICGILPLRFLRINGNNGEYDVLRLKFGLSEGPRKIIIGMIGMGIFHRIEQPNMDSAIWNSLTRRSISVDRNTFLMNDLPSDHDSGSEADPQREMEDELSFNDDSRLETVRNDPIETVPIEQIESVSMQDFVSRYFSHDSNGVNLSPDAYNSPLKIDINSSTIQSYNNEQLSRMDQVVDKERCPECKWWYS